MLGQGSQWLEPAIKAFLRISLSTSATNSATPPARIVRSQVMPSSGSVLSTNCSGPQYRAANWARTDNARLIRRNRYERNRVQKTER